MVQRNQESTDVELSGIPSLTRIPACLSPLEVKTKQIQENSSIVHNGSSPPIPPYSRSHPDLPSQPPLPLISPQQPQYPPSLFGGSSEEQPDALPPYWADRPPFYSKAPIMDDSKEPRTLAMYFFAFGFIFPPLWLFGALMLITPFRSPNPLKSSERPSSVAGSWMLPKVSTGAWCEENLRTEKEKEAFLARMRSVELKWAKRCFVSLTALVAFGMVMGITVIVVSKVSG